MYTTESRYDDSVQFKCVPKDRVRRMLAPSEVARYCSVPTAEVLGWIDAGMLQASHIEHDRYRVATGDFLAFLQKFQIEL